MVLNPKLYARLKNYFGEVKVSNPGITSNSIIAQSISGKPYRKIISNGECYRVCCPFCGDTRFRLYFNYLWGLLDNETNSRNLNFCICYNERCTDSFDNRKKLFEMVFFDTNFIDDFEFENTSIEIDYNYNNINQTIQLPENCIPLSDLPNTHIAIKYLTQRKFDYKYLNDVFHLMFCEHSNIYKMASGRIIIPVYYQNTLVGWQARFIGNPIDKNIPKYYTVRGFQKSKYLYNFDKAVDSSYVVITEGASDAWRYGYEAVSLFGHIASSVQLELLKCNWKNFVILLDGDVKDKSIDLYNNLKCEDNNVYLVHLEKDKDPCDYTTDCLRKLVYSKISEQ